MVIVAQKLFVTRNSLPLVIQFVDNPPTGFAVWRIEYQDKGHRFETFSELVEWVKAQEIFTEDELAEIIKAESSLLDTVRI